MFRAPLTVKGLHAEGYELLRVSIQTMTLRIAHTGSGRYHCRPTRSVAESIGICYSFTLRCRIRIHD